MRARTPTHGRPPARTPSEPDTPPLTPDTWGNPPATNAVRTSSSTSSRTFRPPTGVTERWPPLARWPTPAPAARISPPTASRPPGRRRAGTWASEHTKRSGGWACENKPNRRTFLCPQALDQGIREVVRGAEPVRGDADGLLMQEGQQLHAARLRDGVGVDGQVGTAAGGFGERGGVAADQADASP